MIKSFIRSVLGPELYRIYKHDDLPGKNYKKNTLEYLSSSFISLFHGFCTLCKWTSPVILAYAVHRDYITVEYFYSLCHMAFIVGGILSTSYVIRGIGRFKNPDYQTFIKKYADALQKPTSEERQRLLSQFDFSLGQWTPEFKVQVKPNPFHNEKHSILHGSIKDTIKFNIWRILSYICVDTFGLRMAYPGVIIKSLIHKVLIDGRTQLIEKKKAKRAVVETACKHQNKIDTLFVDQRSGRSQETAEKSSSRFGTISELEDSNDNSFQYSADNGKKLVICCDGNASFYEVGCFSIPIEKGYSTLGWNYPGFGESTGLPYPEQLTSAADAVMQYAFSLGFKPEEIILFSWSIGGFAVSWLSNQYPEIKSAILDACFDNITPLAQQQMPKFATNFVEYTIKHTLNLNVAQLISNYNGPVIFVRRTQDEIISTVARHPSTNRGNNLLLKTLNTRYPHIFTSDTIPYIRTWLSAKSDSDRARIMSSHTTDLNRCETLLAEYCEKHSESYPMYIGESDMSIDAKLTLAFFLADKYLVNFESAHCVPLPLAYFVEPWSEKQIKSYSF